MSLKSETTASEKANTEDDASRSLSKLLARPVTAQLIPLRGLQAPNDNPELTVKGGHAWPCEFISTLSWPSKIAMLGLRWCGYGLELTFSDCYTRAPRGYHDLELAMERPPYFVLSNATTTSYWPSKIAMLGSGMVTARVGKRRSYLVLGNAVTTSNWLSSTTMLVPRKPPEKVMIHDLQGVQAILGADLFH